MSGLEFQTELGKLGIDLPVVFITAHADVPMGVQAMKAGAVEFLCKPFREQDLLDAVRTAINKDVEQRTRSCLRSRRSGEHHETLTPREQEVMALVVSGMMNKQIAGKLGLSEITVKVHRASIMRKMNAKSLAELVRQADAIDGRQLEQLKAPPARSSPVHSCYQRSEAIPKIASIFRRVS